MAGRRILELRPTEPHLDILGPRGPVQPIGVALSPTIWEFVRAEEEIVLVFGPRREGKTVGGVAGNIFHALRHPTVRPLKVAVVRDTWTNLEKSVLETLREGHKNGWWHVSFLHDGTQSILNHGLAHLYFFGMDRPADANKFQSFECGMVWLEEPAPAADLASGIPIDVFGMAISSLSQSGVNPRLQITMNPPDEDHWTLEVTEYLKEKNYAHLRVRTFWIPSGENPHVTDAYRQRLRTGFLAAGRHDLLARLAEGKVGSVNLGVAVTPEYSDAVHIYREHGQPMPVPFSPRWQTFRFWDFGLNPSCIWCQLTPLGNLHVLGCVVGKNVGVKELIEQEVLPFQQELGMHGTANARDAYGQTTSTSPWRVRDIGDAAGNTREQSSSERSAKLTIETMLHTGFEPGPIEWSARRDALKAALNRNVGGRGFVQLDPDTTKDLQKALRGGFQYPRLPNGKVGLKPIKNIHSHPGDAFGYGLAVLFPQHEITKPPPPPPRRQVPPPYSFLGR